MRCFQQIKNRRVLFLLLVIFCLILVSDVLAAPQSLKWRRAGVACGELETGVRSYLDDVSTRSVSAEASSSGLDKAVSFIVLHEACSVYGKSCDFSLCNKFRTSDPLAWLVKEATCSELADEYAARFVAAGGAVSLSAKDKTLARYSKKRLCSQKQLHCQIELCGVRSAKLSAPVADESDQKTEESAAALTSTSQSIVSSMNESANKQLQGLEELPQDIENNTSRQSDGPAEPARLRRALLQNRYNDNLLEDRALRRGLVRLAISAEQKKKSEWLRGGNPQELKVVAERRSSSKKQNRESSTTGYSGSNSGLVSQGRFQVKRPPSSRGMSRPGGVVSQQRNQEILTQ